jgi:AcrR family transcriptional regulator
MMDTAAQLDPRARRSREALSTALRELLNERPLQAISVNEITDRANVNRSTFYAHYTDKYDLFHACVRSIFEDALRRDLPDPAIMQFETLKAMIVTTCTFFGRMTHGCSPKHKQLDPIIETEVQTVLYEYLLAGIQARVVEAGEPVEQIEMRAVIMSWAIFGAGNEYRHNAAGRTPEEIATTVHELLAQAVLPQCFTPS